jgi:hypothetical protein
MDLKQFYIKYQNIYQNRQNQLINLLKHCGIHILYEGRHHLDTMASIIIEYSENDSQTEEEAVKPKMVLVQ